MQTNSTCLSKYLEAACGGLTGAVVAWQACLNKANRGERALYLRVSKPPVPFRRLERGLACEQTIPCRVYPGPDRGGTALRGGTSPPALEHVLPYLPADVESDAAYHKGRVVCMQAQKGERGLPHR